MARDYKQPSIVSGLTVSDILSMSQSQFATYSISQQRKIVGRLVSAGNKRIRAFERNKETSPAYEELISNGGKFSTRGKNSEGLKRELERARAFLKQDTSSLRNWSKIRKDIQKNLQSKAGINISGKDLGELLYIISRARQDMVVTRAVKYQIMKNVSIEIASGNRRSTDEIIRDIKNTIESSYKESQDYANQARSMSEFFPV